jgi:YhcH/YjgK/YiaL family protein
MALFGSLSTVRSQLADPARFVPAFACVAECFRAGTAGHGRLHALEPGQTERVDLAGGAFALLQAYLTKPRAQGRWETHRICIDVQAVAEGEEFMEAADAAALSLHEDLTPGKDVIFYRPFDGGSTLRLGTGGVAVFFPADGHKGGIAVHAPALVRKIVVKVPVG